MVEKGCIGNEWVKLVFFQRVQLVNDKNFLDNEGFVTVVEEFLKKMFFAQCQTSLHLIFSFWILTFLKLKVTYFFVYKLILFSLFLCNIFHKVSVESFFHSRRRSSLKVSQRKINLPTSSQLCGSIPNHSSGGSRCRIFKSRNSCSWMFSKIDALKNVETFTGKHLCWSLLIMLQAWRSLIKRDSNTDIFLWICQNF